MTNSEIVKYRITSINNIISFQASTAFETRRILTA